MAHFLKKLRLLAIGIRQKVQFVITFHSRFRQRACHVDLKQWSSVVSGWRYNINY